MMGFLEQQIACVIMRVSVLPTNISSLSLHQGDAGETGEPGLQGEVGPPVSYQLVFSLHFHMMRLKRPTIVSPENESLLVNNCTAN